MDFKLSTIRGLAAEAATALTRAVQVKTFKCHVDGQIIDDASTR